MRIDKYLSDKFRSRTQAEKAIAEGRVFVNGKCVQPSYTVKDGDNIEIKDAKVNFVSAGGYKLYKALNDFGVSVKGKIYADIGASTGGFTDCLLQGGAKKVYCVDVGQSQLDKSLVGEKVVVIDNFNARNLTQSTFPEEIDGVVIDVSFISLTYVLGGAAKVLSEGKDIFALIKPQFECGGRKVGKNGIVRGEKAHAEIIAKICDFASQNGLAATEITNAPIIGGKNMEYIVHLVKGGEPKSKDELLKTVKL